MLALLSPHQRSVEVSKRVHLAHMHGGRGGLTMSMRVIPEACSLSAPARDTSVPSEQLSRLSA